MAIKKYILTIGFISSAISFICLLSGCEDSTQPKVGIIQAADHEALILSREGVIESLKKSGFIPERNLDVKVESAQSTPALASQIAQKFVGNGCDVLVAIGTMPTQAALQAAQGSGVPVIYASVTDPKSAKLQGNITGVSDYIDPEIQFAAFKEIMPTLKKIGVIYNPGEQNSEALIKPQLAAAKKLGLEIVFVSAPKTSDVYAAALSLKGKVDAIFIDNDNTVLSAFDSVIKAGREIKIPVFVSDTDLVEKGALAAMGPNQQRVGFMAGEMVATLLKMEKGKRDASKIQAQGAPVPHLHLNLTAAETLEIKASDAVTKKALKIY